MLHALLACATALHVGMRCATPLACASARCATPLACASASSTAAFLRDGTRLGYGVHADLGAVPDHVAGGTPLPEVLVAMDSALFPSMSRARKSCRRGLVLVNDAEGRCLTTASPGDRISLQTRVAPGFTPRGRAPFDVRVVYEDDALAVVLKPAGVCTHPPPGGAAGGSMRTAIMHALRPPPLGTPGALYRPHCVHRLDKPTSGVLLCAKTKPALVGLSRAFAERRVRKRYEAIVCGYVHGEAGVISEPIDGQSARTSWRVLGRARSLRLGGGHVTRLSLTPHTGRTHQLRIHCADVLGFPIVGDAEHGRERGCAGSGLYLTAVELELEHPEGGQTVHVEVEPPRKFGELLRREHDRWERLHARAVDVVASGST